MKVARINWQNVGKVTEPGRYMFKFGWVTVTAEDLAIWSQYPEALLPSMSRRELTS